MSDQIHGDVYARVGNPQSSGAEQLETLLIPFALDVNLINPGLFIRENARIAGLLEYSGIEPGIIDGVVEGETIFNRSDVSPVQISLGEEENTGRSLSRYFSQVLREFTTLGLIGVFGLLLMPRLMQAPIATLQQRPVSSLSVGMLSFLLSFPVILIVLLLSLLVIFILSLLRLDGVVVAALVILGITDIGGASLFYFVAIFIARVIVALGLGRVAVQVTLGDNGSQRINYLSLGIGVLVLAILGSLPAPLGWIVNAVALFLGLGAILSVLQTQLRALRESPAETPRYAAEKQELPRSPEDARQFPPPIINDKPAAPGMDNLPEGFEWWDDDETN